VNVDGRVAVLMMSSELPSENLIESLRGNISPETRRAIVVELESRRDPVAVNALLIGLRHSEASVRRFASLSSTGKQGEPERFLSLQLS